MAPHWLVSLIEFAQEPSARHEGHEQLAREGGIERRAARRLANKPAHRGESFKSSVQLEKTEKTRPTTEPVTFYACCSVFRRRRKAEGSSKRGGGR